MNRDSYGLPLTTGSDSAAAFYRDGVELLLSAWCGSEQAFDKAISEDPGFALAHIARARVHQLHMEIAEARTMAALARELATIATRRERQHVAILAAAIEGKPKDALTGAEQHLDEFPCDALVFGLLLGAFGLYAFSGRADHDAARLAICERHARHYGEDWWFLTYLGWSHTEAGNVRAGRTITERAIAIRPQNGNAAHALSHAHFEQGDALAGDAFLSEWLLAHDGKSYLQGHLSWHVALVAVESGDADRALKTYNERIRPSEARYPPLNVFTDCASLLWRLTLGDKTVPASQWNEAAEYGNRFFPRAGAHFADLHHALVAAATDSDSLETRLAELESLEARGSLAPGSSAIDLCRGAKAFAQRDYDKAADLLEAAMPAVVQIGGSHAQRELWEDTLIVACLRSGRNHKAPSSSRLVCSAGPRAAIRHGCGEPRWQQTSRPSAGGRYDAINFTFPRDVKPFTSEIAAIHYIDRQSLSQEAFMSSPRNQHPETRGIDWVAIERIFVLQVLALLALAGAFIGYVNWSSQIAFAEFSAASNRAALESKAHPGSAPAVQAEKRQVPGAGST